MLITGGQGQLGRALQSALSDQEVEAPGHAELDVTDREQVRKALARFTPATVIHAAAWTDTTACERDQDRAMLVNGEAAAIVAQACREIDAAMVYISTNEVFDGAKTTPYVEDDAPNPINAYGRSKLEGEQRAREALDRCCVVRTSWLYGPGRDSFPEKILAAARESRALRLVTDEVASPTWTVDLAGAIARLVREGASGVFHLTNGDSCSRKEWAQEVLRLAGLNEIPVEPTTQSEYGAPFPKPAFSALANVNASRLGITLRSWRRALADHMQRAPIAERMPR